MSTSPSPFRFNFWNQKLHVYMGLYLLLFVGVFAVSGLILNHPKWAFAEFWSGRQEASAQVPLRFATTGDDLAKVRDMMGQLQLTGEIDRIALSGKAPEFRVSKPGQIVTVTIDAAAGHATVKRISLNTWGVLSALHHLTGQHGDNAALTRNTLAVTIWSLFVDLTCVGMLLLTIGGLWIWYQRRDGRVPGLIALLLGLACCSLFLIVL